jgi:hypothetical protein
LLVAPPEQVLARVCVPVLLTILSSVQLWLMAQAHSGHVPPERNLPLEQAVAVQVPVVAVQLVPFTVEHASVPVTVVEPVTSVVTQARVQLPSPVEPAELVNPVGHSTHELPLR